MNRIRLLRTKRALNKHMLDTSGWGNVENADSRVVLSLIKNDTETKLKEALKRDKKAYQQWRYRLDKVERSGERLSKEVLLWNRRHDETTRRQVNIRGTKNVIAMRIVRDICSHEQSAKVVLFSQSNDVLKTAAATLRAYGISSTILQGNAKRRHQIMKSFQEQYSEDGASETSNQFRVLLLSTSHTASGADFHLGTHVFLLDPFAGSKSDAYAAEKQAIGRTLRNGAYNHVCKVMRFVSKNSIEEKLYDRNLKVAHISQNAGPRRSRGKRERG